MNGTLYFNANVKTEQDRRIALNEFDAITSIPAKVKVSEILRKDRNGSLTINQIDFEWQEINI